MKFTRQITLLILSVLTFQSAAYSVSTDWIDAKVSMTQLLNSGWQIAGHGMNRVFANYTSTRLDETNYSFVLTKGGKYIICFIDNPAPPVANITGCRKLN